MKNNNDLDILWILKVINQRKWIIIALVLISTIVASSILNFLPAKYKATSILMIQQSNNGASSELNTLMAGERLALTYSEIISSRPILEQVISKLNLETSVGELGGMISVVPIENTQLVQVSVTDSSANQAVVLANSISETFISYINKLNTANYEQSLSNIQNGIDQKTSEINDIQSQIDAQNSLKAQLETNLTELQVNLSDIRSDYSNLQQNAQSMEQTVTQYTNKIHVVESAHIKTQAANTTYTVSLMLFFDQDIIFGSAGYIGQTSDLVGQIYGPMLERESLLEEVINRLGLSETPASLQNRISFSTVPYTQFLELMVKDDDSSKAVQIADTVAQVFIEQNQTTLGEPYYSRLATMKTEMDTLSTQMQQIQGNINSNNSQTIPIDMQLNRLESDLSTKYSDLRDLQNNYDQFVFEAESSANTVIISEPSLLANEQSKNLVLFTGLSMLLSLFVGLGVAFSVEQLDNKVRTREDIAGLLDRKPIGMIGHIEKEKDRLVLGPNSSTFILEDFRKLSATVRSSIKNVPLRKILITSPNPVEGKSLIASNLAIILAKTGSNVILVDADFNRPTISSLFNLDFQDGLSELMKVNFTDKFLKVTQFPKLKVITSGSKPDDQIELLSSPALGPLFNVLTEKADVVIIDSPPILTLADATFLAPLVDGVLLILKSGSTEKKAALEAMNLLKNTDVKYCEVVLNDALERSESNYGYAYYGTHENNAPKETKNVWNYIKEKFLTKIE